ncbi:hypothetical protein GJ744_012283 [Endocarpon pusillum]|uniref:Uncharacterized protein n=1 Tax=Endocarpon pusillum TaxID=364733 RepID=A0A8H7E472_9EURO|nr:hypothetical protein GJ744_012283 [Endocarpon pusillum]
MADINDNVHNAHNAHNVHDVHNVENASIDSWNNESEPDPDDERCHERLPSSSQRLGWFTIMCLILNRSIGTGIFATPTKIIIGTGNVGPALVMWVCGGLVALSALHVWNELGLTIPRNRGRSVPRSGGEKNYFEYMVRSPRFLVTCLYGIVFLILGNLSGNAIQLGVYVMAAAGHENPTKAKGPVIGIAILALTLAVLVHVCSRRGGIVLNNIFAVFKVSLVVVMILLGILHRAGVNLGGSKTQNRNFSRPFANTSTSLSNYVDCLIYILYTFSGFKQPFYALGEAEMPRHTFPWATNLAVLIQWTLFVLLNVVYIWAVDLETIHATASPNYSGSTDMASLFFESIFGTTTTRPKRTMCALLAVSILGNLIVMTFVAARVKQEIAKEGILPFWNIFAKSSRTPWALFKQSRPGAAHPPNINHNQPPALGNPQIGTARPEQSPIAALFLHLGSSLLLVAVTAPLPVSTSYTFLISLYAYVINGIVGFCASLGLLCLKLGPARSPADPGEAWSAISVFRETWFGRRRWIGCIPALLYGSFTGFLLVASFVPPSASSSAPGPGEGGDGGLTDAQRYRIERQGIPWYVVPVVGLSSLAWGLVWYAGLKALESHWGKVLTTRRHPTVELFYSEDGNKSEYIMTSEIITRRWKTRGFGQEEDHELEED